jgi:hypothetical protein
MQAPVFEKLPALNSRPTSPEDKEIWKPQWHCFCCHDSGFIVRSELVIENPNPNDPDPLCNRQGCGAASDYRNLGLDDRIPSEVCQQIHEWEIQSWAETSHQKWLQIKERIDQLSQGSNRTDNDEREIEIRKENAQAQLDNPETQGE